MAIHIGLYYENPYPMSDSLASLRKAKGLSQEELGNAIADWLKRPIGASYAQKKIARFEAGTAAPIAEEIDAMADVLGVEVEILNSVVTARAPHEAPSIVDQFGVGEGGRSLVATCMLSRPRPQILADSYATVKRNIDERKFSIAAFVPYPSAMNLPQTSDHIQNLFGYYARVRKSVFEANLAFINSLDPEKAKLIALYVPRADVVKCSNVLIPPFFRQFSLNLKQTAPNTPMTKHLHIWVPGTDADAARPIKATGVYSLEEQVDAWESFFGDILPHWIAKNEFLASDCYWERIR